MLFANIINKKVIKMLEHKFKTVRELKDALNECPDDAEIDISELPSNISIHGLTTVFDGKKSLNL